MADMTKEFPLNLSITREQLAEFIDEKAAASLTDGEMESIAKDMAEALEKWNCDSYRDNLEVVIGYVVEKREQELE